MSLAHAITPREYSGITTVTCGIAIMVVVLATQYLAVADMYSNENNIIITENRTRILNNAVVPTFLVIVFSLALSFSGIRTLLNSWKEQSVKEASPVTTISSTSPKNNKLGFRYYIAKSLSNSFCKKIFWTAIFSYIIIFSLTSNIIVYRPGSSFSNNFGVTIPSFHVIGCCGAPGSFPVITIYLADELGFLFIPSNIIIAPFLAFLVGINFSIIAYKIVRFATANSNTISCSIAEEEERKGEQIGKKSGRTIRKRTNLLSGFGLGVGLFAGCPACAGNFLLSILIGYGITIGAATTVTASGFTSTMASTMGQYQPLFIAIRFIALIVSPFFMSRK